MNNCEVIYLLKDLRTGVKTMANWLQRLTSKGTSLSCKEKEMSSSQNKSLLLGQLVLKVEKTILKHLLENLDVKESASKMSSSTLRSICRKNRSRDKQQKFLTSKDIETVNRKWKEFDKQFSLNSFIQL
jgi:hypothetical protein